MEETCSEASSFHFNFPNPEERNVTDFSPEKIDYSQKERAQTKNIIVQNIAPHVEKCYLKVAEEEAKAIVIGSYTIKYITSPSAFQKVNDKVLVKTLVDLEKKNSDLIPGIYEGGFKIWECAIDLAHFLCDIDCFQSNFTVLELGCGAGIPGLIAYLSGCKVTFQDYNAEVLQLSTIPNVYINTPVENREKIYEMCSFVSGEWNDWRIHQQQSENTFPQKYDMIITSETIYEKSSQTSLLNLMKFSLKPSGVIYLAAKAYYFGVGGTLDDFQSLIEQDGTFDIKLVRDIPDGLHRKIMKIRFKETSNKD